MTQDLSISIDSDRIDYLDSLVSRMYATRNPDLRQLGNLALQTILVRRTTQEVLDSKTYSKDDKKKAEAVLSKVNELENAIYRLYYLASTAKKSSERTWYPMQHVHAWSRAK